MGLFGLFKKEEKKPLGIFPLKFDPHFSTTMFLIEDENGNRLWRERGAQGAWFDVFTPQTDVKIYMLKGEEKIFLSAETVGFVELGYRDHEDWNINHLIEFTRYTYLAEKETYWDEEEECEQTRIINWYINDRGY